jgi:hypothetical protein
MRKTRLHCHWRRGEPIEHFQTAISLHGHTMHSEESLGSFPRYASRLPIVGLAVRLLEDRHRLNTGRRIDYSRTFWTPPLSALEALWLERTQIESMLELNAIVSLTDHDNIRAGNRLNATGVAAHSPISLEWTVPCGTSFLHLGIHNLPRWAAAFWMREFSAFTSRPSSAHLKQLLDGLCQTGSVLVVLNHPLWDEPEIGLARHIAMVTGFLGDYGQWIHALEWNGLRSWRENETVLELARVRCHPVVSGGDRHGCEPSAVVNLTSARSFGEFAAEIRRDQRSEILILPQYRRPRWLRTALCAWDIIREHPQLAGRRHWSDRVFYRAEGDSPEPLSSFQGEQRPDVTGCLFPLMGLVESWPLRSAMRAAAAACELAMS